MVFLPEAPSAPDLGALDATAGPEERYVLEGGVFYLHAPSGIGRSKLAAGAEKHLGIPMPMRNWRTVRKLVEMVEELK